jgi:hypothetical protein
LVDGDAANQSSGERESRVIPPNDLLASTPSYDRLRFLGRERRENELGILSLPGQRFGFVQRKAKQMFICAKRRAKFIQDGVPRFLELREELLAACETGLREGAMGNEICFHLFIRIHILSF